MTGRVLFFGFRQLFVVGRQRLINRFENQLVFIVIGERNQEQHPSRLGEESDHPQVSICILEVARAGELLHPAWKHRGV